jgi:hypothetical protein
LKGLLLIQHSMNARLDQREAAGHSFRVGRVFSTGLNLLLLGGLGVYLWRVANPPDEMRFVGATNLPGKFRS